MGSQQTPTFVITPGAWHPASAADLLVNELSAAGFPAQAVGLKTVGAYGPMTDDTKYLRDEVYIPLIESGKDIVVVLHSYGGFPGSTAIQGLGKKDRQGKAGGIVGIVYIAAFVPQEGMSLKANCGGVVPDWQQADEQTGKLHCLTPVEHFYNDVPEDLAKKSTDSLTHHSLQSTLDAPGPLAFKESAYDGRRAYIRCAQDQAIPAVFQDAMVAASGVEWKVINMDASHSPFLSKPKETADHLIEVAKSWSD